MTFAGDNGRNQKDSHLRGKIKSKKSQKKCKKQKAKVRGFALILLPFVSGISRIASAVCL